MRKQPPDSSHGIIICGMSNYARILINSVSLGKLTVEYFTRSQRRGGVIGLQKLVAIIPESATLEFKLIDFGMLLKNAI